jgi:hypothetical protein
MQLPGHGMIWSNSSFFFSPGKSLVAANSANARDAVKPVDRMAPRVNQFLSWFTNLKHTQSWKTLGNQELMLRIGPLGKLGCFELTAKFFLFTLLQSA